MSSGQRTFSRSPSVIYIATDRSGSGTSSMITEDPRHIEPRILRDHGRGTVDAGTQADCWWGVVGVAGGGAGEEVTARSGVGVTARALWPRLGRWRRRWTPVGLRPKRGRWRHRW